MTVPLIETKGLTMRFGGVVAVNNVDFTLREMELRCLIGPNGAGKSTFFKMLTGQLTPSLGTLLHRGDSIAGLSPHQIARRGVGVKTQTPNVFDGLSVIENIMVSATRLHTRKMAREIVDEVVARVELGAIANRQVGILSHGQRQWVEIATVLAQKPDLVLLDEPVAGMSDEEVDRTAQIIREINRERAVVVVEHDMVFIRKIAKTVTVFNQGAVLVEGDVDAVLSDQRVRDVYLGKAAA
ncbi:ATP-binding cassette domain-containing protein [Thioclava sp. GXIMD2076]|uniref:ATP-binding cassette domain-containing protein n=1 Tax=Thioclava kandeliae TaxID=3070818 RepID=A0ABV1SE11_9RHOB